MRKKRFTDFEVVEEPQVYDTYDYQNVPTEYGILQISKKRSIDDNVGLLYTDFNVSNLLKAGATDLLRETPKLKDNAMDVVDKITDNALSDVDGASIGLTNGDKRVNTLMSTTNFSLGIISLIYTGFME